MRKFKEIQLLSYLLNDTENLVPPDNMLRSYINNLDENLANIEPRHQALTLFFLLIRRNILIRVLGLADGAQIIIKLLEQGFNIGLADLGGIQDYNCPISMGAVTQEMGVAYLTENNTIELLADELLLKQVMTEHAGKCPLTRAPIKAYMPLRLCNPENLENIIKLAKDKKEKANIDVGSLIGRFQPMIK